MMVLAVIAARFVTVLRDLSLEVAQYVGGELSLYVKKVVNKSSYSHSARREKPCQGDAANI